MCRSAVYIRLNPGDLICCANTMHAESSYLETYGYRLHQHAANPFFVKIKYLSLCSPHPCFYFHCFHSE